MAAPGKLVHRRLVAIRWGDMDAYGHVNNTAYFGYMQEVRVDYLESLGYRIGSQDSTPVIVTAACTFLLPITYPGVVEVRMYLGEPGRSSVLSTYEIRRTDADAVCATGEAKIVWIDVASGRPVPIPDDLRERFTAVFKSRTRDEWCSVFETSDACFAPVLTWSEAYQHPHNVARKSFVEVGGIRQPAPAPRFSRTPGEVRRKSPERGEGGAAALSDWGFDADAVAKLQSLGLGYAK